MQPQNRKLKLHLQRGRIPWVAADTPPAYISPYLIPQQKVNNMKLHNAHKKERNDVQIHAHIRLYIGYLA